MWASGNGGKVATRDNCNCDGYTNSIYTISVSAATSDGGKPFYLESCASTLVSAYSSGDKENRPIVSSFFHFLHSEFHQNDSLNR